MLPMLLTCLLMLSCAAPGAVARPVSPLEMRYRAASRGMVDRTAGRSLSTSVYQDVFRLSLSSECRMVPHDSLLYDARVKRCGPLRAVYLSAARLLLEQEAGQRFLSPTMSHGQLGWVDLPEDLCAP